MKEAVATVEEVGLRAALPSPQWKPLAFRKPYILFLSLCSIAIIAGTEILIRLSSRPSSIFTFTLTQTLNNNYAESSISTGLYFVYKYLPTLLAVILAALWESFDGDAKRLEPYYQLSQPNGARGEDALLLNYNSIFMPKVPFVAVKKKQYLVALSFVAFLLAGIAGPVLLSALLDVDVLAAEGGTWEAKVRTDMVFARTLQVVHAFVFVLSLGLIGMLHKRRVTGLFASPGSVASLAAMAGPTLAQDLRDLDLATNKFITKSVEKRRYRLHVVDNGNGQTFHIIDRISSDDDTESKAPIFNKRVAVPIEYSVTTWSPWLMILISIFFGIEAFSDKTNIRFIFSHRAIPVLIAVLMKQFWKTMERDLRPLEPFNYLAMHPLAHRTNFNDYKRIFRGGWKLSVNKGIAIYPGRAKNTIFLDYSSMGFFTTPLKAAWNRHFTMCVAAILSWLVEVFTVSMGSLGTLPCYMRRACDTKKPVDYSITAINALVGLSYGIMLAMTVASMFMLLPRIHASSLCRRVDNLASILCWVNSSRMLEYLRPMATMTPSRRKKFEREMSGKKFGLGWISEEGQRDKFGIDEEPVEPFVYRLKSFPIAGADGKRDVVRYRPGEHILGLRGLKDHAGGYQYS